MKEQLAQRLQTLRAEYDSGQKLLAELDAKKAQVTETMLRISGAIQVLEEVLASEEAAAIENNGLTNHAKQPDVVSRS